jgi:hypothetical protein
MKDKLSLSDLIVLNYTENSYPVVYPSRAKTPHELDKETENFKKNSYAPRSHGWVADPRSSF